MQRDHDIEIQQFRFADVYTLEAVPVLDLEAIEDLIAMEFITCFSTGLRQAAPNSFVTSSDMVFEMYESKVTRLSF